LVAVYTVVGLELSDTVSDCCPADRLVGPVSAVVAASLVISAGANVKAVQRILGHASEAMTLEIYPDLFDDLDAVGNALDQARTVSKSWAASSTA